MKKRGNISREKMRYAVPTVCNRFFKVHASFIVLCAVISVFIVTITLAAVVIFGVQELEPKQSLVFFNEVSDIDSVREKASKYDTVFDIYFAANGDTGYPEDSDLASVGVIAALYNINGVRRNMYYYQTLGLDKDAVLEWSDIESIITLARGG